VRDPWIGEAGAVDVSRTFLVPEAPAAAETYLAAHGPAGADISGSGTERGPHGVVSQSVYFHFGNLPSGISDADVELYVVPGGTTRSLVAAYVHVAGQASKTQAEHLGAAGFRAVTIVVDGKATYVFTGLQVITSLITAINALPAAGTGGASSCPGSATDYRLTFQPRLPDGASVSVETYSCDYDTVTVGGVPQPALGDPNNTIGAQAARLTDTQQYAS
jgi:hypothetical protein